MTKNVVYAFPTLKDAAASPQAPSNDPQVVALPLPVIQILFQMLAMKPVDSVVFFETPGNLKSGTEVTRQSLEDTIRSVVQQQRQKPDLPPDIA